MYDSMYCRQNVESESEIERARELRRAREAERGGECGRLISFVHSFTQMKLNSWGRKEAKRRYLSGLTKEEVGGGAGARGKRLMLCSQKRMSPSAKSLFG